MIYKLTWFMSDRMAKYDLRDLGRFLSLSALIAWVIMPLWTFFKQLDLKREDWKPHGRLRRLSLIFGTALGAFTVMCFMPVNMTLKRSGAVELASPEEVRSRVPGIVKEVYVKEGDHVEPGQPLAKLEDRGIDLQNFATNTRLHMAEALVQRALGLDRPADLKQAESNRLDYEQKAEQSNKDAASHPHRAIRGTVLTRDLDKTIGKLLKSGEMFCEIGSIDPMQIKMALTEKQVRYVARGQRVDLKVDAYPWKTIHGKISEVHPVLFAKDLPSALSARRSGRRGHRRGCEGAGSPTRANFEAQVDVDNSEGLLHPGMSGHGAIQTGRHLWGKLVLQSILDLISLDYRF